MSYKICGYLMAGYGKWRFPSGLDEGQRVESKPRLAETVVTCTLTLRTLPLMLYPQVQTLAVTPAWNLEEVQCLHFNKCLPPPGIWVSLAQETT